MTSKLSITRHAPGPWVYTLDAKGICGIHQANNATGVPVKIGEVISHSQEQVEANARRIVAVVNACDGISTKALEQGAVGELLAACQMVVDRWERGDLAEAARLCSAALAKATGRAA